MESKKAEDSCRKRPNAVHPFQPAMRGVFRRNYGKIKNFLRAGLRFQSACSKGNRSGDSRVFPTGKEDIQNGNSLGYR